MEIHASAKSAAKALRHFWSVCVGAGRANEGLRANWLEHLSLAVDQCGFRYCRFHGLFHDDMFVYRLQDGRPIYNWQYIDELFDRMLDRGVRPFVELGFCPKDLTSLDATLMWWQGHTVPPNDLDQWGRLVEAFTRHCVQRYGLDEVRSWYFEVWNEPNLKGFWHGSKSAYFKLYQVSVEAIKAVDSLLRVGGPATSNFVPDDRFDGETEDAARQLTLKTKDLDALKWKGVWVEQFLDFCQRNQLPVDFVSTHPYPTDFALDEDGQAKGRSRHADSTREDLQWVRDAVDRGPFPKAEIHLTEWSSSPSSRDFTHDYLQAATYIVRANAKSIGLVDSLSYWAFTDVFEEKGAGDTVFHGGFGTINFQGIVKPAFHAYRLLHALGDEVISCQDDHVVTRRSSDRGLSVLAWHYPPEVQETAPMCSTIAEADAVLNTGRPETIRIKLSDLPAGAAFCLETLDRENGFALKAWQAMGSPEPPTRQQAALLRDLAAATKKEIVHADDSGVLHVERTMAPWTVLALRQV